MQGFSLISLSTLNYYMFNYIKSTFLLFVFRTDLSVLCLSVASVVVFFLFPYTTYAYTTIATMDFEDYSIGDLNGQFTWTAPSTLDIISSSECNDAVGKCAKVDNLSVSNTGRYSFSNATGTSITTIDVFYYLKISNVSTSNSNNSSLIVEDIVSGDTLCLLGFKQNNGRSSATQSDILLDSRSTGEVVASSSVTTSNWLQFRMQIDVENRTCKGFAGGVYIGQVNFHTDTVITGNYELQLASFGTGSASKWYDDITILTGVVSASSSVSSDCTTCTRVISTLPSSGQTLATTTNGYTTVVQYYITEDDHCLALCESFAEISIQKVATSDKYIYNEAIPAYGYGTIAHNFSQINATGTYVMEIRLYNEWIFGAFRNEQLWQIQKFYVGSPTSQAVIDAYASSSRETGFNSIANIEAGSDDIGSQNSPGVISMALRDTFTQFLYLPPWGYVVMFNTTLMNGTTTAVTDLTIQFSSSSPAYGKTLTLPIDSGIDNALAQIDALGPSGEYGDTVATIMHYWALLWYGAFLLWIIMQLTGISFGTNNNKNTSHIKDVDMRKTSSNDIVVTKYKK